MRKLFGLEEKKVAEKVGKRRNVCFLSFDLFVLRRVQLQSSVHRLGSMSMCHRRFLHFFFFSSHHSSNDYFKFMTAKNAKFSATVYWKDGAAVPEKQVPAKKENAIRFACISDTHCKTKQFLENDELCMPACDVIIHAGDFTVRKENCLSSFFISFLVTGHWNQQGNARVWRILYEDETSDGGHCRKS